jgi:hypothetical protein
MNDGDLDMEQRLRTAFRAVAELPTPAALGDRQPDHRRRSPRPPRRLVIAVVSVAALALVVALALAFGPRSAAPPLAHPGPASPPAVGPTTTTPTRQLGSGLRTEQLTYRPFNGAALKPDLHVSARQSGTCFQYGGGAQGRYLYRCGTMQPCVAGSLGPSAPLACPLRANPAANDIVLWTATSVDTTGFVPATAKTPFAMQLADGAICALVNAAWSGLGPFGCNGSPAGGAYPTATPADCHQPVPTTTPYWTAQCQGQLTPSSPFSGTTVAKVWF